MRPTGSAAELERRRCRAVALVKQGHGQTEVARLVHASARSVRRWWRAYQRMGAAGLAAKPPPGRPHRLSPRRQRALVQRLLKGARANGFPTDLWTCPRIAELIERRYGVRYHVDHIPRLLARLGFSCQKPERRALERDEAAIRGWVARDWPRIKKSPSPAGPPRFH